jgi:hypothetical protein
MMALPAARLAASIERVEADELRAFVAAARRLRPQHPAESLDVAGGVAAFVGVDSPLSQTTGLRLDAPIGEPEVETITRFYLERGCGPKVWVNPFAGATLATALARAGYVPATHHSVMALDLTHFAGQTDARIALEPDAAAWGRASAMGFFEKDDVAEDDVFLGTTVGSADGVIRLAARTNGAIVATGAMSIDGEIASLFSGSTRVEYRKLGWHRALILDRLARARDGGARFARVSAVLGSDSERNFRRCGFAVLYTRSRWERRS